MVNVNGHSLMGIAARIILRLRHSSRQRTHDDKLLTIRAATPYNNKQKQCNGNKSVP